MFDYKHIPVEQLLQQQQETTFPEVVHLGAVMAVLRVLAEEVVQAASQRALLGVAYLALEVQEASAAFALASLAYHCNENCKTFQLSR